MGQWLNDGSTQFVLQDGNDTLYGFNYKPELMVSISNGIGATTNITYDRLNKNTFYRKCPTSSSNPYDCDTGPPLNYPKQHVDAAIYVVTEVDASNGLGICNPSVSMSNCYTTTYTYAEGQTYLNGRGFAGFGTVVATNAQTNVVQTTNYSTTFPYTGMITSQNTTHGATTLSSTTNTVNNNSGCGQSSPIPYVYFVCTTESVVLSNDLNGAAFPTVTTDYTYDDYGNAVTVNASVSDGSYKDTTNTYYNSSGSWILGRLLTMQVTSHVGTSTLTRQSSFAYDIAGGTGLLTEEDIEPGVYGCGTALRSCELLTSYTYDAFGHRITTTVSGSGITTRTSYAFYDANGQFQTSDANALGQYEFWTYDARFGTPLSHTGPNFLTTNWTYDTFGRMMLEARPDSTSTKQSYAYCSGACPTYGQFYSQAEILGSNGLQAGPISGVYFDMLSRGIANDSQGFDGSNIRVATVYDANERVLETSRPYFTATGSPAYTSFTYDDLGRVIQATFPDSSHTTYGFNALVTTVTNNLSQVTTTTKNAQGLNASVQDALGHMTSYVYDAFGGLSTVTDPSSNVVSNSFDIRGNKVSSHDPDMGSWSYTYDVLGELTSQTDAKGQNTTLTYDVLGRPLARAEPNLFSSWTYGASASDHNIGQLTEAKACPTSSCTIPTTDKRFAYDGLTRPSQMLLFTGYNDYVYADSYNPQNGQLALTAYPSGFVLNHLYNQYGYLCRLTDYHHESPTCSTFGAGTQVFATVNSRDAELHLTQYTAGNNVITTQTFDPNTGLIETQRAGTGDAVASFDYSFDTIGNLTSRTDNDTAFTERFCFDALNRLTNYNIGPACTGKLVAYDSIGNISSKSDTGTYSYPASGSSSVRPHAVSSISGVVDGLTNPQYSYDANGNLTCVSSGTGCTSTVARRVALTSFNMAAHVDQGPMSVSVTYDDQHNRVSQTTSSTGSETLTTYLNDAGSGAMGLQTVTTNGPTKWNAFNWGGAPWGGPIPGGTPVWTDYITLDGQIVAQRDSANNPASAWGSAKWNSFQWGGITTATNWGFTWGTAAWGGTVPVSLWGSFNWGAAPWSGPASMSYFTLDHLGSVAVITSQSGAVVQRLSYDPWGKQRNPNGTDVACGTIKSATIRGFTNQEEMPAQCIVNLNARLYDASIGRFMAADSIVPNPFDGQSFNRYSYVQNNPLSFTDPTGHGCGDDWFCRISGQDPDYTCAYVHCDSYVGGNADFLSNKDNFKNIGSAPVLQLPGSSDAKNATLSLGGLGLAFLGERERA